MRCQTTFIRLRMLITTSLSLTLGFGAPGIAEVYFPTPDFRKTVTGVTSYGEVYFDEGKTFRLWGLNPNPDLLKEFITGKYLACLSVGSLTIRDNKTSHTSNTIWCAYSGPSFTSRHLNSFSQDLIRRGVATELCSETKGYLGHCN